MQHAGKSTILKKTSTKRSPKLQIQTHNNSNIKKNIILSLLSFSTAPEPIIK
jgi:hypothetical protein